MSYAEARDPLVNGAFAVAPDSIPHAIARPSTHLRQGVPRPRSLRNPTVLSIGRLSLGQEAYYLEEVLDGAEDY